MAKSMWGQPRDVAGYATRWQGVEGVEGAGGAACHGSHVNKQKSWQRWWHLIARHGLTTVPTVSLSPFLAPSLSLYPTISVSTAVLLSRCPSAQFIRRRMPKKQSQREAETGDQRRRDEERLAQLQAPATVPAPTASSLIALISAMA